MSNKFFAAISLTKISLLSVLAIGIPIAIEYSIDKTVQQKANQARKTNEVKSRETWYKLNDAFGVYMQAGNDYYLSALAAVNEKGKTGVERAKRQLLKAARLYLKTIDASCGNVKYDECFERPKVVETINELLDSNPNPK